MQGGRRTRLPGEQGEQTLTDTACSSNLRRWQPDISLLGFTNQQLGVLREH